MSGAVSALALVLAVSATGIALVVGVEAATGRYRWVGTGPRLAVVEALAVLLAVLDVVSLTVGQHPREPATHLAYLVVSVAVVPLAVSQVRGDDGRWAGAFVGVALVMLAVIVVRQLTTWRAGG